MKTYYIYNIYTDEFIGTVEATSVIEAEYKAYGIYNMGGNSLAAFTEKTS